MKTVFRQTLVALACTALQCAGLAADAVDPAGGNHGGILSTNSMPREQMAGGAVLSTNTVPLKPPNSGVSGTDTASRVPLGSGLTDSGGLWRSTVALVLVLGGLVAVHVLLKRYLGTTPARGHGRLRIIERLPIDQKKSLLLVSLDDQELLLGGGAEGISLLSTVAKAPQTPTDFEHALATVEPLGEDATRDTRLPRRDLSAETGHATRDSSPRRRRSLLPLGLLCMCMLLPALSTAVAEEDSGPAPAGISIRFDPADSPQEYTQPIRILLLMTLLSVAPSAIVMMTSFTRILIVFGFLRRALGTQQAPPGQVLAAMALFLTLFVMAPVWHEINDKAVQPFLAEEITGKEAWTKGVQPLRAFMGRQTGRAETALFVELRRMEPPAGLDDVPLEVLIPAFMMSELKTAFQMGFLIYLPFLIIDLVISSSLMSLGMFMLPPMMISLPIKVLFFVLADGWTLMTRGLVASFAV